MRRSKLSIDQRDTTSLLPRPNNEKLHTAAQIDYLKNSIATFGFNDPIGISPAGEIIEGMGRWEAAKQLGLATVSVIVVDHLDDLERRAYGVAHNQTMLLTGLDVDRVLSEFDRLAASEEDFASIGFSPDEVQFMHPDQVEDFDTDRDAAPEAEPSREETVTAIVSRLRFDDAIQQARFEQFVQALRDRYPMEPMLSDRLMRFIDDFGDGV